MQFFFGRHQRLDCPFGLAADVPKPPNGDSGLTCARFVAARVCRDGGCLVVYVCIYFAKIETERGYRRLGRIAE